MVEKGRSKLYTKEVKGEESRMDAGDKGFRTNRSPFGEEVEQSGQYLDEAVERTTDYLFGQGKELSHQFRGFWDWANNSTVTISRGDEVMAKIPASVGIIGLAGTLFSSRLAVVGALGLASIINSGYNLQLDTVPEHNLDH
jgi:hypothetical protein